MLILLVHVSLPSLQVMMNLTSVLFGTLSLTLNENASSIVMLELALTFPMFAVAFVISMYSEFSVDNVAVTFSALTVPTLANVMSIVIASL